MSSDNKPNSFAHLESIIQDLELSSVNELSRTLIVEICGEPVKLEIWFSHTNPKAPWDASVYRRDADTTAWYEWPEFPWVGERDEEACIRSAIAFAKERLEPATRS